MNKIIEEGVEYIRCAYPRCGRYCKVDLSNSLKSGQFDKVYGNRDNIYCSRVCSEKMEGWEKALREVIKIVPNELINKIIELFNVTFDDLKGKENV